MATLSAVIIARDEGRSIARCIDSLIEHVDEVLVLDTGSGDDTVAIAAAHGARVEHFAWVDDFSAARNRSLELAAGDWRLVVDADEWLSEGYDEIAALRDRTADFIGLVSQDNVDSSGRRSAARIVRVMPREVRYRGRIHEQPEETFPVRDTGIVLSHDGYLEAQLDRKQDRNRILLEAELSERPDDAYLRFSLGKEHEVFDRAAAAVEQYELAYRLAGQDALWRHDLVVRYLHTLSLTGRTPEALELAETEQPRWLESADFYFVVGEVALAHAIANPHEAAQWLGLADGAWSRCLELGDTPSFDGAVEGRGSHLAEHNLKVIRGEIA